LHFVLATAGLVAGGTSGRGLELVWAYYFHDHLLRTDQLLRTLHALKPTQVCLDPIYFLEAYGVPPDEPGLRATLAGMQAELDGVYGPLEALIRAQIRTWDWEGRLNHQAEWAEALKRCHYAALSLAEIEAVIAPAEQIPGYYDWEAEVEYGTGPNLPLHGGLRARLAEISQTPIRRQVLTQPALFGMAPRPISRSVTSPAAHQPPLLPPVEQHPMPQMRSRPTHRPIASAGTDGDPGGPSETLSGLAASAAGDRLGHLQSVGLSV
jgi:hypothetical protein